MSLASFIGLTKVAPEVAAALEPILKEILDREEAMLTQFEEREAAFAKSILTQTNGIIQDAMNRLDGAELVAAVTLKLPQVGSKIAVLPDQQPGG